jgi:hypothetical protein
MKRIVVFALVLNAALLEVVAGVRPKPGILADLIAPRDFA